MKKIIVLAFFILFLTTGCYDYVELNKVAIVSGISIDYIEDEYHVSYEILNTKSKQDNPDAKDVYIAKGKGENISEAFHDTTLEIAKTPILSHLKTVVLSEEIAENHIENILDYLARENYIRKIFLMVVAKDYAAYEILENTDTNNPIASTAIKELIENTDYRDNIATPINFEQFGADLINPRTDAYISSITINNGELALGPIGIFDDFEMKAFLTEKESSVFNVLTNTSKEKQIKIDCPNDSNKFIMFNTYKTPETSIEIKNNDVTISTEVEVRIVENHCDYNFKKEETYEILQKSLSKKLKSDIQETVETLLKYNSDVLKVKDLYYKKYKKDINATKLNYKYEAKAIINRNGIIFEVK